MGQSMERMFKLTVFANIEPHVLAEKLQSARFKINQKEGGIHREGNEGFFRIIPFRNRRVQVARGFFQHGSTNIIVMQNKVVFQHRGKIKHLSEELREIEDVRDKLFPKTFDLFSFLKEDSV